MYHIKALLWFLGTVAAIGAAWLWLSGSWVWLAILVVDQGRSGCKIEGHILPARNEAECETMLLNYVLSAKNPSLCGTTYVYYGLGDNPDGSGYRSKCQRDYAKVPRQMSPPAIR